MLFPSILSWLRERSSIMAAITTAPIRIDEVLWFEFTQQWIDTTRDAVGLLESHHHFPCYCLRATARTRLLWFVPTNAQKHSIEDNMDSSLATIPVRVWRPIEWPLLLNSYSERLAASVWTVIGDDVRIDWSRSIVKDAVFLSCMNQYGLIQPTNSRLNRVIAPRN